MSIGKSLAALGVAAALVFAPLAGTATAVSAHAAPIAAPAISNPAASATAADHLAAQMPAGYLNSAWGSADVSSTIDAALALHAAGGHDAIVTAATAWLQGQAAEFTEQGTNVGRIGKLALHAAAVGADPTSFGGLNLVELMTTLPVPSGNPYSLALLVMGLARTGTPMPAEVLEALLATADPGGSGAFGFGAAWPVDQDSTALAAQALFLLVDDPQAQTAAQAASDFLAADAAATGYWSTFSPSNTAGMAIPALTMGGHDTTAAMAWLVGQQRPDGGFPASVDGGTSNAYATAQALIGLAGSSLATTPAPALSPAVDPAPEPEPAPEPAPAPVAPGPVPAPVAPGPVPAPVAPVPAASAPAPAAPGAAPDKKPTQLPRTGGAGLEQAAAAAQQG